MAQPKELTLVIARTIVRKPDQVRVEEKKAETVTLLELSVAPDDMGRIIGKKGQVANAMRTLLSVSAAKEGKRVNLEIVDGLRAKGDTYETEFHAPWMKPSRSHAERYHRFNYVN